MTVFRAISVQLTTIYLRILFYHLIYTIFSPFSNHKLRGQVHAECAPNRAGCEGRGGAQWNDAGRGDRDERAPAILAPSPGGVLRDRQESPDQPHEQVRRLEEPAQHLSALSHAQADD